MHHSRVEHSIHDANGLRLSELRQDMNKRTSGGKTPLYLVLKVYDWQSEQRKQGMAKVAALLREAGAQEPA